MRKRAISSFTPLLLSVCPHFLARFTTDIFFRNLLLGTFEKLHILLEMGKNIGPFTRRIRYFGGGGQHYKIFLSSKTEQREPIFRRDSRIIH